jgi:hypothetical protein
VAVVWLVTSHSEKLGNPTDDSSRSVASAVGIRPDQTPALSTKRFKNHCLIIGILSWLIGLLTLCSWAGSQEWIWW